MASFTGVLMDQTHGRGTPPNSGYPYVRSSNSTTFKIVGASSLNGKRYAGITALVDNGADLQAAAASSPNKFLPW